MAQGDNLCSDGADGGPRRLRWDLHFRDGAGSDRDEELRIGFIDLGERRMKNIARPVTRHTVLVMRPRPTIRRFRNRRYNREPKKKRRNGALIFVPIWD
jgi:hypothetical protein